MNKAINYLKRLGKRVLGACGLGAPLAAVQAQAQATYTNPNIESAVTELSSAISDTVTAVGVIITAGLIIFGVFFAVRRGKKAANTSS